MFHVPRPNLGPEGFFCCVKGCANFGTKKPPGVTFHKFPSDLAKAKAWIRIVRENSWRLDERDRPLSRNSIICSDHFNERDIDRSDPSRPCIREGAVPMLFPPVPECLRSKRTIIRKIPVWRESEMEGQDAQAMDHSGSSGASVTSQEEVKRRPCISEVEGHVYKVNRGTENAEDSDDSSCQYEIVTLDEVDKVSPAQDDVVQQAEAEVSEPEPESPRPRKRGRPRGRPRARVQTVVPPTSEILYDTLVKSERFRSVLPPNWHRIVHVAGANGCVIFACYESRKQEGSLPSCTREVFVDRVCRVHCFVGGARVDPRAFGISDDVNTLEDLVRLIAAVDALRFCRGAFRADECADEAKVSGAHLDLDLTWRADDCPQIVKACRSCESCARMRKLFLQRLRKVRQEELLVTSAGLVEGDAWSAGSDPQLYQHFLLNTDGGGDHLDLQF